MDKLSFMVQIELEDDLIVVHHCKNGSEICQIFEWNLTSVSCCLITVALRVSLC